MTINTINEYSKFYDIDTAESYDVKRLDMKTILEKNDYRDLIEGQYYAIGLFVYKFIGKIYRMSDIHEGNIYIKDKTVGIKDYKSHELMERFSISNIYDSREPRPVPFIDVNDIIDKYVTSYINDENIMATDKDILVNAGNVFTPVIKEDDDPLTYLVKSMILKKGINLADYKNNYEKAQQHQLNNMRSALIGTTKTTSINYFLEWCNLMDLDWYIRVWDDGNDTLFPLGDELVISNNLPLYEELPPDYPKTSLLPILSENEDPLKRIIKVAIMKKRPVLKEYKTKCPSDFTLTNMSSSLKGRTKMTINYFRAWCDILGMHWSIEIIDKEQGPICINTVD